MKQYFYLVLLPLLACHTPTSTEAIEEKLPTVASPQEVWNVGFLIMDGVYNTELTAPMDIFQHTIFHTDHGMKVFTVAESLDPIQTFEGLRILPDYSYRDSLPPIHVLVVPSAEHHLDSDLENEEMIHWVQKTGRSAQYILSLCDGAFVLAQAGLLDGLASTTFPSDIAAYKKRFPQLDVHSEVLFVHDQQAITSAGGAKSFEPALYLCELLYGKKAADGIARGLVIDWDVHQIPKVINLDPRI